ncbi:SDR family NAD(P)-dependent oxidoreductase [Flexithrix dorotheae]|uniref:SDR family NAD(P)-dependent oxidoreductase n=1 Tax=Flexithrix dorotheae TaxID=70993 RepID=UPI000372EF69|nr:SDR family oxidoreductase [Flexithrix dorotheae]
MENGTLPFDLTGKIALVTGGGSGIGESISMTLAKHGANVQIIELNKENAEVVVGKIKEAGGLAKSHSCNVANQEEVLKVVEDIFSDTGQINILVNNAGIAHIGNVENTSETDLDRIYGVNIKGVYNCLHACIPKMKASGGGSIINMASIASYLGIPDRFAYSMSKGATMTMTYSVACDYIKDNIRCNAIAPARVHTPFVDGFLAKNYPGKEKEMFENLSKTQPIGRMGKPEEIAHLTLYLCSDEASFITGGIYPIDGGFSNIKL